MAALENGGSGNQIGQKDGDGDGDIIRVGFNVQMAWGHTCCRNYNKNTKRCGAIKQQQQQQQQSGQNGEITLRS